MPAGPTPSWAPAYVRVAVPFGATLVSLLCFAQAVRLAVHVGFQVRVIGVSVGKHAGERSGKPRTLCMVAGDVLSWATYVVQACASCPHLLCQNCRSA